MDEKREAQRVENIRRGVPVRGTAGKDEDRGRSRQNTVLRGVASLGRNERAETMTDEKPEASIEESRPPRRSEVTLDPGASLTPEEGFLLSRIDGATTLRQLAQLTAMPVEQVAGIVAKLETAGLVTGGEPEPVPAAAPRETPPAPASGALFDPLAESAAEPAPADREEPGEEAAAAAAPGTPSPTEGEGDGRRKWETELRLLDRDIRIERARGSSGIELKGFCFDPDPAVIRSVLENALTGLGEARLIAAHHTDPNGLLALASRTDFASDDGVRRLLYRNNQFPEAGLRRLLGTRPLREMHRVLTSREVAERSIPVVRNLFRERWLKAEPSERIEILFTSEGRILTLLVGLPAFDEATAALFCRRQVASIGMIRAMGAFPALLPNMVLHLLRQPMVARNPTLKRQLEAHPNCPSRGGRG